MPNWSDFFPDAAYAGAFGTGTPQEEATRAPTPVDNAVRAAGNAVALPGKVLQSQTPMTSDQMVGPATDLASFVTLGSGAMPAEANSLRMGIKAYHGSPHDFDRFDMSKIGTGEGAQAYGHGLYFAEHEPVAQQYRDQLQWKGANFDDPQVLAQNALDRHGGDRGLAADNLQSSMDSVNRFHQGKPPPAQAAANEKTQQAIDLLRGNDPITGKPNAPGRMYEVNINADPAHFLDWDKPLSGQSQAVRDALAPVGIKHGFQVLTNQGRSEIFPTLEEATSNGPRLGSTGIVKADPTGAQILESRKLVPGDYADRTMASQALRDAGIPGIKYLDQGSRGVRTPQEAKGLLESARADLAKNPDNQQLQLTVKQLEKQASGPEPSHNYVVFDDSLIDILRKYGWAGIAALPALQSREDRT